MGKYDYDVSKQIAAQDYPFFAIIMAAARQADTQNLAALERAFPEATAELKERYNAPGGILPRERGKSGTIRHRHTISSNGKSVRADCDCGWTSMAERMNEESYTLLAKAIELHESSARSLGRRPVTQ